MADGLSPRQIEMLFVHLAVILAAARVLGDLMRRLGQPAVLGELSAGILLGPSVLGWAAPGVFDALFPPDLAWRAPLEVMSWFGLTLLMLFTGLETDVRLLRSLGRSAFMASAFGLLVPFGCGFGLGMTLPDRLIPETATRPVVALFLATALSVSAMPVIAKILMDLKLLRRNFGLVTLTAAVVDDTVGWICLAVIAGLAGGGGFRPESILKTLALLGGFLALARFALFPASRWLLRLGSGGEDGGHGRELVVVAVLAFMCAAATEAIGVHAVFGAFVAGTILRQVPWLSPDTLRRIEGVVVALFAPIFFGGVGLKVDFTAMQGLFWPAAILVVAILCKVVGCVLGGKLGRMNWVESFALAVGMNARGAMGLVVAVVGVNLGVIGAELFASIVLVAVVTSFIAPLAIRPLAARLPVTEEERAREAPPAGAFLPKGHVRILVPTSGGANALLGAHLAAVLCGDEGDVATALYVETERRRRLPFLSRRRSPMFDAADFLRQVRAQAPPSRGLLALRQTPAQGSVSETILREVGRGQDFLFLGASGESHPIYDPFVAGLVRARPCHIVVVRGFRKAEEPPLPLRRILVPTNGSRVSDAAFELAAEYSSRTGARMTALHITEPRDPDLLLAATGLIPAPAVPAESVLATLRARAEGRVRAELLECRVREGRSVPSVLEDEAELQGYDLVVLGAENRSIVERVYLGQTVEAALDRLTCAVAVVIPKS